MDTILIDAPSVPPAPTVSRPRARLPGEDDHLEPPQVPTADTADRPGHLQQLRHACVGRKVWLMSGAAAILVGVAAGVAYHERARIGHLPVMQHVASAPVVRRLLTALPGSAAPTPASAAIAINDVALPPPVHPQAAAAAPPAPPVTKPAETVHPTAAQNEPPAKPAPAPAQPAATAPHAPTPQQVALSELAALQSDSANPSEPAASAKPPPLAPHAAAVSAGSPASPSAGEGSPPPAVSAAEPHAPTDVNGKPVPPGSSRWASLAAAPQHSTPGLAAVAAPPEAPAPVSHPAPARLTDPVQQAVALQATPMATPEQIDLLHLMTEMAVVVRDLRTENGELRSQVEDLAKEVDTKTTQFDRRLSVAEAKGAIAAAMGAGQSTPATITVTAPASPSSLDTEPLAKPAAFAPPPLVRNVKDYRIQAASPGLAMLSTVGLTNDGTSSIQVAVGDEVPGVGRIKAIYQHGANWVVQTDNGLIQ